MVWPFKTKKSAEELQRLSIQQKIPIEDIREGIVILKSGEYRKILEVSTINFDLKTPYEKRQILKSYQEFINQLDYPVQIFSHAQQLDIQDYINEIESLATVQDNTYKRDRLISHSHYLHSLTTERNLMKRHFFLVIPYVQYTNKKPEFQTVKKELNNKFHDIARALGKCQLTVTELTDKVLVQLFFSIYNHDISLSQRVESEMLHQFVITEEKLGADLGNINDPEAEAKEELAQEPNSKRFFGLGKKDKVSTKETGINEIGGGMSILDRIAPGAYKEEQGYIQLNGFYSRVLMVVDYPRKVEPNWLGEIYRYNGNVNISTHIIPTDKGKIVKQLSNSVGELEAKLSNNPPARRRKVLEAQLRDADTLLEQLSVDGQNMYYYCMYIHVTSDSLEELDMICRRVESLIGGKKLRSRRPYFAMDQAFNSVMPIAKNELELSTRRNMPSSTVATTFPFDSSELTFNSGVLKGINQSDNSVVIVDRFSLPNPNETTLASSGAGKSFYLKLDINRYYIQNVRIFVIDPEREYKRLCRDLGGQHVTISAASGNIINPLEIREAPLDEFDDDGESNNQLVSTSAALLRQAIQRLLTFFGLIVRDMSATEKAYLEDKLILTYKDFGVDFETDISTVTKWPILTDLHNHLEADENTKRLAIVLKPYVYGSSAAMFNGPTNVNLDAQLVVMDIHELEEEVQTPTMFMLLTYLWDEVKRDRSEKKLIYVDEAWLLADENNPRAMKFLRDMFKRIRKYKGGITVSTQNLSDFLSVGKYGSAIINNAYAKFLLRQGDEDMRELKKLVILSEREETILSKADQGEGLMLIGNSRAQIRTEASLDELAIIDPEQYEQLTGEKASIVRRGA